MLSYIYILALILIVCLFVFVVNLSGMYFMDHMVVGNWSSGDFIRYMAGRTNRRLNVKCGYPHPLWSLLITTLYHLNHHAAA